MGATCITISEGDLKVNRFHVLPRALDHHYLRWAVNPGDTRGHSGQFLTDDLTASSVSVLCEHWASSVSHASLESSDCPLTKAVFPTSVPFYFGFSKHFYISFYIWLYSSVFSGILLCLSILAFMSISTLAFFAFLSCLSIIHGFQRIKAILVSILAFCAFLSLAFCAFLP